MQYLYDVKTGERIGPATPEQAAEGAAVSEQYGGQPGGVSAAFYVDSDGIPRPMAANPAVYGTLRAVYTQEDAS